MKKQHQKTNTTHNSINLARFKIETMQQKLQSYQPKFILEFLNDQQNSMCQTKTTTNKPTGRVLSEIDTNQNESVYQMDILKKELNEERDRHKSSINELNRKHQILMKKYEQLSYAHSRRQKEFVEYKQWMSKRESQFAATKQEFMQINQEYADMNTNLKKKIINLQNSIKNLHKDTLANKQQQTNKQNYEPSLKSKVQQFRCQIKSHRIPSKFQQLLNTFIQSLLPSQSNVHPESQFSKHKQQLDKSIQKLKNLSKQDDKQLFKPPNISEYNTIVNYNTCQENRDRSKSRRRIFRD